jgi:hypothetical protein
MHVGGDRVIISRECVQTTQVIGVLRKLQHVHVSCSGITFRVCSDPLRLLVQRIGPQVIGEWAAVELYQGERNTSI